MRRAVVATTAALIVAVAGCGSARWQLREENDFFTAFNDDADYTQGFSLARTDVDGTWELGQQIYTPPSKRLNPPPTDERPYAGYAYVRRWWPEQELENSNYGVTYGYELGLVGPGAGGKDVQCGLHDLLGQYCPAGWSHQLRNEPTLTGRIALTRHNYVDWWVLTGELQNQTVFEAGNLSVALHNSTDIRWGTPNLFYTAGPRAHVVAHDLYLDGNTYQQSPSVNRRWAYAELAASIGVRWRSRLLQWTLAISSPQYEEQNHAYNYGAITVEW